MKVPAKMKALVIEADKVLTYKNIPVPELKADEVLVKVRACGICGKSAAASVSARDSR